MKSNGFGSFEQIMVFSVDREWATRVAHIPGMIPLDRSDDDDRSYFEFRNWSTRTGNDEDAAWYLRLAFQDAHDCKFIIDWKNCVY
jgi:hypothetical protein